MFRRNADECFRFLVVDHGFSGPHFFRMGADAPWFPMAWITFAGRTLQVELALDWRDDDVACFVRKFPRGEAGGVDPRNYPAPAQRRYVGELVISRGRTPHVANARGRSLEEAIPLVFAAAARNLRDFLPDVLADARDSA